MNKNTVILLSKAKQSKAKQSKAKQSYYYIFLTNNYFKFLFQKYFLNLVKLFNFNQIYSRRKNETFKTI